VVGSKITNEILFEIFNSPTSGVNMTNAALPAIGSVSRLTIKSRPHDEVDG
jgi:hypothetical protein